jgi:beta-N-acetylhexosaminidase
MTLSINPGIFFIFGLDGVIPQNDFLLLERNFEDPDQLRSLTSRLKSAAGSRCMIAVDQEPGRVQRFQTGFPKSKMPADYLMDGSTDDFREWCAGTASILNSAGIDMNLAPVVDMLPAGTDYPVLKDRAFGDNPEVVSIFAEVLIEEHKKKSVLTCAKHFPGLGSAVNDPHLALAVSEETIERLRDYHWHPFAAAVRHGVDCVMTTHLLAGAVDEVQCATYSKKAIEYLRRVTGHSGPVISDDLLMTGARAGKDIAHDALNAIESGHNFIIISENIALQGEALETVARQLNENETLRRAAAENEKIIEKIGRKFK